MDFFNRLVKTSVAFLFLLAAHSSFGKIKGLFFELASGSVLVPKVDGYIPQTGIGYADPPNDIPIQAFPTV